MVEAKTWQKVARRISNALLVGTGCYLMVGPFDIFNQPFYLAIIIFVTYMVSFTAIGLVIDRLLFGKWYLRGIKESPRNEEPGTGESQTKL